jgi:DNA topoisomerase-1
MDVTNEIKISRQKLKGLLQDGAKSAEIISLRYVSDKDPGISRRKRGKGFIYIKDEKTIRDKNEMQRIRSLVIPPAWQNVWICCLANGHLQATGYDSKNRKQYLYHSLWSQFRNQTKFFNLFEFGKKLPAIREQLERDLAKQGLPLEKILAAIVSIMQHTNIRVGNNEYEKLYGSFGLTTLKDKHVTINGSHVKFCFKGKKGIYHEVDMRSRKLANIVQQCRDMPGKELFQYYDEHGERRSIDSGMVNDYIKQMTGGDFTTKDFRTWTGTANAISVLKELGSCESETEAKKNIADALDIVAKRLGNTRTVCKKYYVHPRILELYSTKELEKWFDKKIDTISEKLSEEETILLKILGSMR